MSTKPIFFLCFLKFNCGSSTHRKKQSARRLIFFYQSGDLGKAYAAFNSILIYVKLCILYQLK